jgi:tetratricopeptide (TPR) repeat protein
MEPIAERLASAVKLHEAGRLTEAEALYRGILHEAPAHPHALHLLGVAVHQLGRHAEAAERIERALAIHGPHPVFLSNLAAVYLDLDRLDDTVAQCRAALQLQPNLPDAHHNLGVALMRQGQLDAAETAFTRALRLKPAHIDARSNLGACLHRQGRLADALTCLEHAVRLAPQHAQAHNDLGGVLLACKQVEPAIGHFREAIRLRPAFAEAHTNLGLALRELGRLGEAADCYREALRVNPRHAAAHNNLGYLFEAEGRLDEARDEFLKALALDPYNAMALASLSGLAVAGHYDFPQDQVESVRRLVDRPDVPVDDRGRLHFALARMLDAAGSYDEAFAHYQEGNALRQEYVRRRGAAFDPAAERRFVDRLIALFSPAYFERVRSFGVASELPIFIVGMMRSGTTVVEQILASHPDVHGAGELRELGALTASLPERLRTADPYPECLARLDVQTAQAVAQAHLDNLQRRGGTARRVVDKMPVNFQHLGLIATLFPRAQIIHCHRDPIDTCLSCFSQNFGEPQAFTLDLRHLGFYYRQYERLMAHWKAVLPAPIFELQYEELTAEPEAVSRRLLAFCGLDWDERCLRPHEAQRPVRTASMLQVRKPIYRSAVGRWKRYEKHVQPLLEALAGA